MPTPPKRRLARCAALALAVGVLAPNAIATAATTDVHPGRHALQRAINAAAPGDVLRVHRGTYRGSVEIAKRLVLRGVGGRPTIDARCRDDIAIDVLHRGVKLSHLRVQGAEEGPGPGFTINFIDIATGAVRNSVVKETCGNEAEYGINIFDSGDLAIEGNHTFGGFADAGIYVGGIEDTRGSPLVVKGNEADGNNRGIIIEDSFAPVVRIRVIANRTHDNARGGEGTPSGIFIHNSDGGVYARNRAGVNGDYGIHLDENSDGNRLSRNSAHGNGIADLFNEGSGNCAGAPNSFGVVAGAGLAPC